MRASVNMTQMKMTATPSTSPIIVNAGYLKSIPGFLKLAEFIIGAVCLYLIGWNFWTYFHGNTELFFLCMATTFFIGTLLLLASCLVSLSTGGMISHTIYELMYHSVAFILYLISSVLLMIKSTDYGYTSSHPHMLASIFGVILSVLYLISAIYAQRSYRGI